MNNAKKIGGSIFRKDLKLSDGRVIRYYDSKEIIRNTVDTRPLDQMPQLGEIRLDPLVNEWTIISSHRSNRAFYPTKEQCPLCPAVNNLTEIPEKEYEVVVFDNRFPSLAAPNGDWALPDLAGPDTDSNSAAGHCEVISFTSEHNKSFKDLELNQLKTILIAWIDRVDELSKLPYIEQVAIFENRGVEVGVTLHHPHGQVYAYPFIPARSLKMYEAANKYFEETGKVLMDEIIAREIRDKVRIIFENDEWIAYVPYAAKYPFEIQVAPKRSVSALTELDNVQINEWPEIAKVVLTKLDSVFGIEMPYIAAWHQAPVRTKNNNVKLHWQINSLRSSNDKLKYLAGSESAMGAFVMDMTPEMSAKLLKEARI